MNWSTATLTSSTTTAKPPTTFNMSSVSHSYHHNHSNRLPDMDIIEDAGVQALFFVCYTTIFVLGVFGNVLVCYVVGRNRAMQTVTNFFITNLALSDILLCILAVPFTPLYSFLRQWIFGRVLCHLVAYAQGTSVYISTLTLTSIAIDRFFVIIYPFQPRMQVTTCIAIISSIWVFSVLVTLPYGLYMNHNYIEGRFYCEEIWPSERFRQAYGALTATFQFLIPFLIIAFCYVRVSLKLSDRARRKPGASSSRKEEAERDRKRRTNRMLIAMVTIFGISWLPLNAINLLNDLYIQTGKWRYYHLCFFTVHALAMSSTCYNPFLYAWLNDNFRKEFKQVLPCFDPTNRQSCGAGRGRAGQTSGIGGVGGGTGSCGGRLLSVGARRSISSAVRTVTTTDDWLNKSASHSPPSPTAADQANDDLSRSSQEPDGGDGASASDGGTGYGPNHGLFGRKSDSVEVENVVIEPIAAYNSAGGRVQIIYPSMSPNSPCTGLSPQGGTPSTNMLQSANHASNAPKRRPKARLFSRPSPSTRLSTPVNPQPPPRDDDDDGAVVLQISDVVASEGLLLSPSLAHHKRTVV